MKYKLIAFDIDGTLLDDKKQLPEENLRALKAAAAEGVYLVPATGRIYGGLPQPVKELEGLRWCITVNGAYVYDRAEDKAVYRQEIPNELALRICDYMSTLPVIYDCYKDNWGYMSRELYEKAPDYVPEPGILDLILRLRTPVDSLEDYLKKDGGSVQKLQMFFKDLSLRDSQLEALPRLFPEIAATSSVKNNVEINFAAANKGDALLALCRLLGIKPEETVAFGDGSNDISMLRAAGLGVAMANASDKVKAAADHIADSNENAGLGKLIEQLLAGKEL